MLRTNRLQMPYGGSARSRQRAAMVAVIAVAGMVLTGCGSSAKARSGKPADLAAAQAIVDKAEARPATIEQTKPITGKIPTGKRIVFLSCGIETCKKTGDLLKPGAEALGWTVDIVTTDGSAEQVSNAFTAAIRSGADVVYLPTADIDQLAAPLKEAEAKGVLFASVASTDEPTGDGAYFFNMGGSAYFKKMGEVLAAKAIVDSKGSAQALYVNLPEFSILGPMNVGFEDGFKAMCPSCKTESIDVPFSSVGKDAPDLIVSALRARPDVKYLVLSEISALEPGLPAALKAAGLNGIKILGESGSEQVYTDVTNGEILGTIQPEGYSYSYGLLDALARKFAGDPPSPVQPNLFLLTKDNIPDDVTGRIAWPAVADMHDQYLKLWGK